MKKSSFVVLSIFAFSAHAADLSGTYQCLLWDQADGKFNSTLELALDKDASQDRAKGYASYEVTLKVDPLPYSFKGIAAAHGNDIAIYFESVGKKRNPDDRGVGIATVILDKDQNGKDVVSLHKFYYEKAYKRKGNTGFENCTRVKE